MPPTDRPMTWWKFLRRGRFYPVPRGHRRVMFVQDWGFDGPADRVGFEFWYLSLYWFVFIAGDPPAASGNNPE